MYHCWAEKPKHIVELMGGELGGREGLGVRMRVGRGAWGVCRVWHQMMEMAVLPISYSDEGNDSQGWQ